MPGSRAVKTLTALFISMTIGAFVLMFLETAPVRPQVRALAAVSAKDAPIIQIIRKTSVPIQPLKWRKMIVYSSTDAQSDLAARCHFTIGRKGQINPTELWKSQLSGYHISVPGWDFDTDCIALCVIGDFSRRGPSRRQFAALVNLVRVLQPTFDIPGDHVYLHSEIDAYSHSPGDAFPTAQFNAQLLRRAR